MNCTKDQSKEKKKGSPKKLQITENMFPKTEIIDFLSASSKKPTLISSQMSKMTETTQSTACPDVLGRHVRAYFNSRLHSCDWNKPCCSIHMGFDRQCINNRYRTDFQTLYGKLVQGVNLIEGQNQETTGVHPVRLNGQRLQRQKCWEWFWSHYYWHGRGQESQQVT